MTAGSADPRRQLARHTWTDLSDRQVTVLLPLGALEQHGPHLPLSVDTIVARHVARRVARRLRARGCDVLVAPALSYGASGEHEGFAGTISIGREALTTVLVEYGRSACRWADRLVLVNGHGGNLAPVLEAVALLRREGRAVAWTECATVGADPHAGRTETSLLLALAPRLVRTDRAVRGETAPLGELMPVLARDGLTAVSATGVLGDATLATEAEGRRLLAQLVRRVSGEVRRFRADPRGRLGAAPPDPTRPVRVG